ncbi:hypothetical protein EUGRSUZ_D00466 [Eucalyptus grandis]|uniref:Uncharacterized protein n=2 Tax=Eucalyptus grandis TaxID=71139 RepID=A0A059CCA8_EUCGR|nr:hypothetical protein EUGRSUZ_D00466 [Eucalyptus grandis]
MARFSIVLFMTLMIVFAAFAWSTEARKLLEMKEEKQKKKGMPLIEASLIFSVLPKGDVPGSAPSKKGHASPVDRKLLARHLMRPSRILRSVISPGFGY